MNRKEFTNLLLEWRKNFIHERTTPQLQPFIRENFPVDVVFTNITIKDNPRSFKEFLSSKGYNPNKVENSVVVESAEHPFLAINKSDDFKNALLSTENAFLTAEDRAKFEEAYNNSDPMILSAGFVGNNASGSEYNRGLKTAQFLYWLLHDMVHELFEDNGYFRWVEENEGKKFDYDINSIDHKLRDVSRGYSPGDQYQYFSKDELDSGKLKEKPQEGNIYSEFVSWFVSIGFTPFAGSTDLQPSLFAYAITKLSKDHDAAKREIDSINELSDDAKSVLVISHKVAFKAMETLINEFQNKILIACKSQFNRD